MAICSSPGSLVNCKQQEKPFRHSVIDGFLSPDQVSEINAQWPRDWHREDGKYNRKWSTQRLPEAVRKVVSWVNGECLPLFERETGISGLFADPDLFGAGLHCIPFGGFLKMHVDFNQHPKGWRRRVNVLIYLNEQWDDAWGGHLRLGLTDAVDIAPIGGRCVIFETNDQSWHGHPEPLRCPASVQRRSLALYYYTADPLDGEAHTTIYRKAA